MQPRLLIVDDDPEMREALGDFFSRDGHACELAADASAALEAFDRQTFDVVICDVLMEGMNGLQLLDRIRKNHPTIPFIVITGKGGVSQAVAAIKRGAFEYMVKPCDGADLRRVVSDALDARRRPSKGARIATESGTARKQELLGSGPAMRALQTTVDLVARSSAPVLIVGETGVGKEIVARAIHARSVRHDRPFVAVNTAAIPRELLEAEIFGHVRGGFTGAVQGRKGLLTEADGGTLLLDEIGDMSFDLQAKLLRVLQFGELRPVGSDQVRYVDVRVIASTHRDLPVLIAQGLFREDLYFRLHVLPVLVPPLRERAEDIPMLVAHFLAEARRRAPGSPVRSISQDALECLREMPWPGNVRELASCVERAVVFGASTTIGRLQVEQSPDAASSPAWPCAANAPWTLRRMGNAYTEWVLMETRGNKERAAEILGIDLTTLYRRERAQKNG